MSFSDWTQFYVDAKTIEMFVGFAIIVLCGAWWLALKARDAWRNR